MRNVFFERKKSLVGTLEIMIYHNTIEWKQIKKYLCLVVILRVRIDTGHQTNLFSYDRNTNYYSII